MDTDSLRAGIAGTVVTPADPGWDEARRAWNLAVDQHPDVVVRAASVADVATTVRFAREAGLRVAPQSTGHGACSMGTLEGAILLRTDALDDVAVDADARTARVGAGTRWRAVVAAAGEHGLVALHGMSGGVGVAGYVLGGGLGWLVRSHGFASTHVRSFEVVTADGEARHVDAGHEPDLFWALRGGGGAPAIVTAFELELFALEEAYAGSLLWPIEQASVIAHAWRVWIAGLPATLTSTLKLVRFPPLDAVPEPMRGRALVSVTLAFAGGEAEGAALVAPLRAAAEPYLDTLAAIPAPGLADVAGDPQDPLPGIGGSMLLAEITPEVIDAFVALNGPGVESTLVGLEIRHIDGALATPAKDPGAAGTVDAQAIVWGVGMPVSPEVADAIRATHAEVRERLAPWGASRTTLLTFDEGDGGLRSSLPAATVERLAAIGAAYDPGGLLLASHVPG